MATSACMLWTHKHQVYSAAVHELYNWEIDTQVSRGTTSKHLRMYMSPTKVNCLRHTFKSAEVTCPAVSNWETHTVQVAYIHKESNTKQKDAS